MIKELLDKTSRAFCRTHIVYQNKKDNATRHWILKKVAEKDETHLQCEVYEVGANGRPEGPPKFRKLIRSRIQKKYFQW